MTARPVAVVTGATGGIGSAISVVTVSPGYTNPNILDALRDDVSDAIRDEVPLGRFAAPEEIAAAVVFLASPGGACITGADIPVNGGLHIA